MRALPTIACAVIAAVVLVAAWTPVSAAPPVGGGPSCAQAIHVPLPATGAALVAGVVADGNAHYYSFDVPPNTALAFLGSTAHLGWNELGLYGPDCSMHFAMGFNTPNVGGGLPAGVTGEDGGRWVLGVHLSDGGALGHAAYAMQVWPCPFDGPNPCLP